MKTILVVGAGFAGAVYAHKLAEAGYAVHVVDQRSHIGGNAYDYVDKNGIRIHAYGPHLFHTKNRKVIDWIQQFTEFVPYTHKVRARLPSGETIPMPINLDTVNAVFGSNFLTDFEVKEHLKSVSIPIITSFAGSVSHTDRPVLSRIFETPKTYCRDRLLKVLQVLATAYGPNLIRLKLTGGYHQSLQDRSDDYFEVLANSKFCVAPRGTSHETFRIYEGLRVGCVVIADRLPNDSFYRKSPIIQIDHWMDLPKLLKRLLADPEKLAELQKESLRYWSNRVSEQAFAAMCAKCPFKNILNQ